MKKALLVLALALLPGCNPGAAEARGLRAECESGDPGACTELGLRTYEGRHVLRDWREAQRLYRLACESGYSDACYRQGLMLVNSFSERGGVSVDTTMAYEVFTRGCDADSGMSCVSLGDLHLAAAEAVEGAPDSVAAAVVRDPLRARELYERGCDGNAPRGCTNVGRLYADGVGVEADGPASLTYFQRACDGEDPRGCTELGRLLLAGELIEADAPRAATLFEAACEEEMLACHSLGELYRDGRGVDEDKERALELFEEACFASQVFGTGSPPVAESCFRAGEMYANADGVSRNLGRAGSRFRRACRLGYEEACSR